MSHTLNLFRAGAVAVIEINNPPVNALSQVVRRELLTALFGIAADDTVTAVVLSCAGKTFVAGADINEFTSETPPEPDPNEIESLIENFRVPVVAALHGNVLGGGLELALSCHYRIALASTRLGLPEVKLGLLPGAGGTQRLPRLAGVRNALTIMTSGVPISAAQARDWGIVDAVVGEDVRTAAIGEANRIVAHEIANRKVSELEIDSKDLPEDFFEAFSSKLPDISRGGGAARAIVQCVENAVRMPFAKGLELERAAFNKLRETPESIALRHCFFAEREATHIPGVNKDAKQHEINSVGVVGAGTMGAGIAMCFASAGIPVTIIDVSEAGLQGGLDAIRANYQATVHKGRLTAEESAKRIALIRGSIDDAALRDCDLVVEAVFENLEIKKMICQRLGDICKPGAIIATNTSTLDVDFLAAATGRPNDVVGMHFFSPANVMKLLEVVRGAHTAPDVLATVMAIAKKIGKVAVVSGVCYGFIGNRMLEGYLREAELMLMEGAKPSQIDRAIEATGMAMGPCRMIDMAGVDTAAKVVLERQKAGGLPDDASYRAVVRKLFELGRYGQKTAAGYYRYEGRTPIEDPVVLELCAELARIHGIVRRDIADEEIVERLMLPLMSEGAKIVDEKIAYRPGDIDVVWIHGYGFPAYKGGPMHCAARIGADALAERLDAQAARFGNTHGYWTVDPLLIQRAVNA